LYAVPVQKGSAVAQVLFDPPMQPAGGAGQTAVTLQTGFAGEALPVPVQTVVPDELIKAHDVSDAQEPLLKFKEIKSPLFTEIE
jgi:hypothetical protein